MWIDVIKLNNHVDNVAYEFSSKKLKKKGIKNYFSNNFYLIKK